MKSIILAIIILILYTNDICTIKLKNNGITSDSYLCIDDSDQAFKNVREVAKVDNGVSEYNNFIREKISKIENSKLQNGSQSKT